MHHRVQVPDVLHGAVGVEEGAHHRARAQGQGVAQLVDGLPREAQDAQGEGSWG